MKNNMKAIGIVAEYNPFHDGHKYQIETSAKSFLADVVVIAISGNFVQRGELAICDKWKRTEMALRNGADLVLEIPTQYCLNNAGVYARAGIEIFKSMGLIDAISFGSEIGDINLIKKASSLANENKKEINDIIKSLNNKGYSFPRARQIAFNRLSGDKRLENALNSANDTLGMEYLSAWNNRPALCIKRNGSSATEIRNLIKNGSYKCGTLPKSVEEILFRNISLSDYSNFLKERDKNLFEIARFEILKTEANMIDESPQGGEGLGNRLIKSAIKARTFDELIELTKSKRYTYTRISRLIFQVLLGIDNFDYSNPDCIRVLGFNDKGRELLREMRNSKDYEDNEDSIKQNLDIVTNINKYNKKENFDFEIKATNLYNAISDNNLEKEHELRKQIVKIIDN